MVYLLSSFPHQILKQDSQARSGDAEIQQRALEYMRLATVASADLLVRWGREEGGKERGRRGGENGMRWGERRGEWDEVGGEEGRMR